MTRGAPESCDLLIVGGGINGVGIARDAAGRGLSVVLCEQHDLGAHTSSASTKLIHGGLRYLENLELRLVRKSLKEREVLLEAAPHIMWPLQFVMPHDAHLRPMWAIRAGLLLYDRLARRRFLPASARIDLRSHPAGAPLDARFTQGFVYADGWVDDARLVVLNALAAAERGAAILTRTRCERLGAAGSVWRARLVGAHGSRHVLRARAVVNATGPWVADFLCDATPVQTSRAVRLVKGSHIIVPRLFEHPFAYIFQAVDKRIVFAIPYEQAFTLIGTTEVDYEGPPGFVRIDENEVSYLCKMANRYFLRKVTPADIVRTYSGVRPLLEDESVNPSNVTRDYALELDERGPPLLSVFGGKITTYRRLAEEAVTRLGRALSNAAPAWTAGAPLPGGDLPCGSFAEFLRVLELRYSWLPPAVRRRQARAYGTRIDRLLWGASSLNDLGEEVLPGLYAREIDYLRREEWAQTAEDILWRRSKLGLHLPPNAARLLDDWLAASACSAGYSPLPRARC